MRDLQYHHRDVQVMYKGLYACGCKTFMDYSRNVLWFLESTGAALAAWKVIKCTGNWPILPQGQSVLTSERHFPRLRSDSCTHFTVSSLASLARSRWTGSGSAQEKGNE